VGFEPTRAFTLPVFKTRAACNSDRLDPTSIGSTEPRRNDEPIADDSRRLAFTEKRRTVRIGEQPQQSLPTTPSAFRRPVSAMFAEPFAAFVDYRSGLWIDNSFAVGIRFTIDDHLSLEPLAGFLLSRRSRLRLDERPTSALTTRLRLRGSMDADLLLKVLAVRSSARSAARAPWSSVEGQPDSFRKRHAASPAGNMVFFQITLHRWRHGSNLGRDTTVVKPLVAPPVRASRESRIGHRATERTHQVHIETRGWRRRTAHGSR